jgi:hypothetical protein
MAQNMEQPPEAVPLAARFDLEAEARAFMDSLRRNDKLRELGFTDNVEELARSVLCALWRNTPLPELDGVRGVLPAGLDLMFASCERPHGRRAPPRVFFREALVDDVTEHLGIPRAQAIAASDIVLEELRGLIPDHDVRTVCLTIESPDLLALMRCLT